MKNWPHPDDPPWHWSDTAFGIILGIVIVLGTLEMLRFWAMTIWGWARWLIHAL